jgi:hypothetical protein
MRSDYSSGRPQESRHRDTTTTDLQAGPPALTSLPRGPPSGWERRTCDPRLHLARAASQGPHYFIPIECITAKEQQRLKSLPKRLTLPPQREKPRRPGPQADITGILGSCLSTQPPTVDKQDVSIKKPAVHTPRTTTRCWQGHLQQQEERRRRDHQDV